MTTALAHPPLRADETAVRGAFQRLLDAWGRGDGGGTIFAGEAASRPSRDSILHRTKLQWMLFGIADRLFRR